jgi:hypothetical protein
MTRFSDFAERFHITPEAQFGSSRRLEYIALEITTVPGWRWRLKTLADLFRFALLQM